jgi:endonuclease/exonuclease/phosphatase family metal-dependent hydrolase
MDFKITSANLRFDNPADAPNDWNGRKKLLTDAINNFAPDLLGTQEGRQPQLKDLESLLPNMKLVDTHREWIEERMYPCIFINTDKINVLNSGDIWLSKTPYEAGTKSFDSSFPRLCTWIEAEFKENNKKFFYINLHLDHMQSHTREEQIKVMLAETKKQNKNKYPVFITGDFNESPEEKVHELALTTGPNLQDSWQTLNVPEETSHHQFGKSLDKGSRIDWILVDKAVKVKAIKLYKESEEGIYPSDHFPVFGEFTL